MKKNKHGLTYVQWLMTAFGKDVRIAEIPEGAQEAWEDGVDPNSAPAKVRVNWAKQFDPTTEPDADIREKPPCGKCKAKYGEAHLPSCPEYPAYLKNQ